MYQKFTLKAINALFLQIFAKINYLKMKHYLIAILLLLSYDAISEEGMWLPNLIKNINEQDIQSSGLKLTAEDLYSINPGIVYCSMSAWGQSGPYLTKPAHDLATEAVAVH